MRAAAVQMRGMRLLSGADGASMDGPADWAIVPTAEERAAVVARLGLVPFRVIVVPALAEPAMTEQQSRSLTTALARMRAIGRPRPHVWRGGVLFASVSRFLVPRLEQLLIEASFGRARRRKRSATAAPLSERDAIALRRWQALRRAPTRKELRKQAADRRQRNLERANAIVEATRRWNCPGA